MPSWLLLSMAAVVVGGSVYLSLVASPAHRPAAAGHVSTFGVPQPRSVTSQLVVDPSPHHRFPQQYPVHLRYGTPVNVPGVEWGTSGVTNVACSPTTCWAAV